MREYAIEKKARTDPTGFSRWQSIGPTAEEHYTATSAPHRKEGIMHITFEGVVALRTLRIELQEDAGLEFPQGILTELLVLHDVCKKLDLTIFQAREVLGEIGWRYIQHYLSTPVNYVERPAETDRSSARLSV